MRTMNAVHIVLAIALAGCRESIEPVWRSQADQSLVASTEPRTGAQQVTLDSVDAYGPPHLIIEGSGLGFDAVISNHTSAALNGIATQGWIEQGKTRRAAGGQLVSCGAAIGVLPPGKCIRVGNGFSASNSNAGTGTLVPGLATAIVTVSQVAAGGNQILASRSFRVRLFGQPKAVLSVDVTPTHAELGNVGDQLQLTANVTAVGGAPTTVTWVSSNAAVAAVNTVGHVVGLSPGAALITATSTFDPSKSGTSLVSVATFPSFGNGVNVSPGFRQMGIGSTVQLAAQVVGPTQGVVWFSSNAAVAAVSMFGQVVAVGPGSATITAMSKADANLRGTATIAVYSLSISSPSVPTAVSTGATQPPANSLSVQVSATTCGAAGTFFPGITRVDFTVQQGGGWVAIGSSGAPVIVDNGQTRCFTWTLIWTPGTAFGTGVQTITATGYDAWGVAALTPWNTRITLTDP